VQKPQIKFGVMKIELKLFTGIVFLDA